MASVNARSGKPRHLEAVAGEDGSGGPKVSLADRFAAAQAAVAGPQRRVSELEGALAAAVENGDYAAAAVIQQELPAAREALALAEVDVRVITEAQAALDATADAEARQIAEARQRDEARRVIGEAHTAEQQALAGTGAALAEVHGHLAAAQAAYRRAMDLEAGVLAARQRAVAARAALGEYPPGHPGPAVTGSNKCQVLADSEPLIRELARWRP